MLFFIYFRLLAASRNRFAKALAAAYSFFMTPEQPFY
jgi:hypothetical protein